MRIIVNVLAFPLKIFCLFLVYLYKILISPLLPKSCKFSPSCSTYCVIAIKRFGVVKGIFLTSKRILRCNDFSSYRGVDAVPDNLKGELKWLI